MESQVKVSRAKISATAGVSKQLRDVRDKLNDGSQERSRYLADRACLRLSLVYRPNWSGRAPLSVSELERRSRKLAWILKLDGAMLLSPVA